MRSKSDLGLSKLVDGWMRDQERRNLKMLSRLTGVPYTSLRRIVQNEVEPNLDQTLSILSYVANSEERLSYLEEHFPDSAKLFKSMIKSASLEGAVEAYDDVVERYVESPEYCELIELADSHHGLTRNRLDRVFGKRGIAKIAHLIDDEILREDIEKSSYRLLKPGRLRTVTLSATVKRIKSFCDLFLLTRRAAAYSRSESVSDDGLLEIKHIITDTYQRVARVMDDPKFHGDIPISFAMICGRYHEEGDRS